MGSHKQGYPSAQHEIIRDSAVLVAGGYGVTNNNILPQSTHENISVSYSSHQKQRTAPNSSHPDESEPIASTRVDSHNYLAHKTNSSMELRRG